MSHIFFIRRCLELAQQGRGKTGINPMVGAVLVRDEKIIAEGFHSEFGKAHAERDLLESVILSKSKDEYKISSTDTLYINLEPCCHTQKKTPPCTDFIIKSGVKHVVFGMRDPNPEVSGKGIEALKKEGIEVIGPLLEDECLRLNRGFISLHTNHRPWITLKIARTPDGRIAHDDGSMMAITSARQNAWSHEYLRARHDAILVGVGTILTDDSRLTVRLGDQQKVISGKSPYRIILDAKLQISLTATVVTDSHMSKTIIVCAPDANAQKKKDLESRGLRVIEMTQEESCSPCGSNDKAFDCSVLFKALTTPSDSFYGISSILVEGGPKTWESFRKAEMVDEEVTLIGG